MDNTSDFGAEPGAPFDYSTLSDDELENIVDGSYFTGDYAQAPAQYKGASYADGYNPPAQEKPVAPVADAPLQTPVTVPQPPAIQPSAQPEAASNPVASGNAEDEEFAHIRETQRPSVGSNEVTTWLKGFGRGFAESLWGEGRADAMDNYRREVSDGGALMKAAGYGSDLSNAMATGLIGGVTKMAEAGANIIAPIAGNGARDAVKNFQHGTLEQKYFPSDMTDTAQKYDENGEEIERSWGQKIAQIGKGVASVTGEFAPAVLSWNFLPAKIGKIVASSFTASNIVSGGINRYNDTVENVKSNSEKTGLGPVQARLIGGAAAGADMLANALLFGKFKGIWNPGAIVGSFLKRQLAKAAGTGVIMGTNGTAQSIADQMAQDGELDIRKTGSAFVDGAIEGALFHTVNEAVRYPIKLEPTPEMVRRRVEELEAAREYERSGSEIIGEERAAKAAEEYSAAIQTAVDVINDPQARAAFYSAHPDIVEAVMEAKREGRDVPTSLFTKDKVGDISVALGDQYIANMFGDMVEFDSMAKGMSEADRAEYARRHDERAKELKAVFDGGVDARRAELVTESGRTVGGEAEAKDGQAVEAKAAPFTMQEELDAEAAGRNAEGGRPAEEQARQETVNEEQARAEENAPAVEARAEEAAQAEAAPAEPPAGVRAAANEPAASPADEARAEGRGPVRKEGARPGDDGVRADEGQKDGGAEDAQGGRDGRPDAVAEEPAPDKGRFTEAAETPDPDMDTPVSFDVKRPGGGIEHVDGKFLYFDDVDGRAVVETNGRERKYDADVVRKAVADAKKAEAPAEDVKSGTEQAAASEDAKSVEAEKPAEPSLSEKAQAAQKELGMYSGMDDAQLRAYQRKLQEGAKRMSGKRREDFEKKISAIDDLIAYRESVKGNAPREGGKYYGNDREEVRDSRGGGEPATDADLETAIKRVGKFAPGLKVEFGELGEEARKSGALAEYDVKTNTVRFPKGTPLDVVAHEIGWHAAYQYAKKNNHALLKRMVDYAMSAPKEVRDWVYENYGDFDDLAVMDEIGARRFELEKGGTLGETIKSREAKTWYGKMLRAAKDVWEFATKGTGANLDGIERMTPQKAIDVLAQEFVAGRRLREDAILAKYGPDADADGKRRSIGGVYTGSAADYAEKDENGNVVNGPSLEKVGTGEGSQVYGWGLYGSNKRGVAESYASVGSNKGDSGARIYLDGKPIEGDTWTSETGLSESKMNEVASLVHSGNLSVLRKFYGDEVADFVDKNKYRISTRQNSGNVYEQTFFTNLAPGDESHLLNWYEPVSKENYERIEELYKKEFGKSLYETKSTWIDESEMRRESRSSGQSMYGTLKTKLGSPQAASEFLARADIDGVKYPVDSYGKQVKDGEEAGWNYVSFRDDNIRVDHKWVDGEKRYARGPVSPNGPYDERTDDGRRFNEKYAGVGNSRTGFGRSAADKLGAVGRDLDAALSARRADAGEEKGPVLRYSRTRVGSREDMERDIKAHEKMRFGSGKTRESGMESLAVVRDGDSVYKYRDEKAGIENAYLNAARNISLRTGEDSGIRYRKADKGYEPKETRDVYKLMRLARDEKGNLMKDGNGNPVLETLYIGREKYELGNWYMGESPDLGAMKDADTGFAYLVDENNNIVDRKPVKGGGTSITMLPSKKQVLAANDAHQRWVTKTLYKDGTVGYANVGINGSGGVAVFAMRPGIHAGSLPSMQQIGSGALRNLRDNDLVWVKGKVDFDENFDRDVANSASGEVNDRMPEHGYVKGSSNFVTKGMAWYISPSFKPEKIISDAEAERAVDSFNATRENGGKDVGYDYPREGDKRFYSDTMSVEDRREGDVTDHSRHNESAQMKKLGKTWKDIDFGGKSDGNIRYARGGGASPSTPQLVDEKLSKARKLRLAEQDKLADWKHVQDHFKDASGRPLVKDAVDSRGVTDMDNSTDFYNASDRANGLVERDMRRLQSQADEVVGKLAETGVTLDDLNEFLALKHVEERNLQIAKKRGDRFTLDYAEGAGISTRDADNMMRTLERRITSTYGTEGMNALNAAERKFHEMMTEDLVRRHDSGRLSDEQFNNLSRYKHYAPLKVDMDDAEIFGGGGGKFGRDEYRGAKGFGALSLYEGGRLIVDPFNFGIAQAQNGIAGSHENVARNVAANLIDLAERNGQHLAEVVEVGERGGTKSTAEFADGDVVDVSGGKLAKDRDDIMLFKKDGKLYAAKFEQGAEGRGLQLAKAANGHDMFKWGERFSWWPELTRKMSAMRTQFVPTFIVRNLKADLREGVTALLADKSAVRGDKVVNAVKDVGSLVPRIAKAEKENLKDILAYVKDGDYAKLPAGSAVRRLIEGGLLTKGGVASEGYEGSVRKVKDNYRKFSLAAKTFLERGTVGNAKHALTAMGEFIGNANEAAELSTRCALGKILLDRGVPINEAVKFARDATTNFNRKGYLTPLTNGLFMFSNAAIQGSVQNLKVMTGPRGRKVVSALVLGGVLGAITSHYLGNDDEREKTGGPNARNESDYDRKTKTSLPIGGGNRLVWQDRGIYATVGYIAKTITEGLLGDKTPGEVTSAIADEIGGVATDPVGGNGVTKNGRFDGSLLAQSIAPSLIDPLVQLMTGKDFKGDDRRAKKFDENLPDSHNGKRNTPKANKELAQAINYLTGGNEGRKGAIDIAPEDVTLIVEAFIGGIGRDLDNITKTAGHVRDLVSPDKTVAKDWVNDVPFLNDWVRRYPEVDGRFYNAVAQVGELKTELSKKPRGEIKEFVKENPIAPRANDMLKRAKEIMKLVSISRGEVRRKGVGKVQVEMSDKMKDMYEREAKKRMAEFVRIVDKSNGVNLK